MADLQMNTWLEYVKREVRTPTPPTFAEQWRRFNEVFADRPPQLGPPPAWSPGPEDEAASNLGELMSDLGIADLPSLHRWSLEHRADFWEAAITHLDIPFADRPTKVLGNPADPLHPAWLEGATLDVTEACFVASPAAPAVISGREGSEDLTITSFDELRRLVHRVANGIRSLGLADGEGVALYMPMNLECVAAYLGVIRAGRHVVSIADSFAAEEVAKRIRLGDAGAVVTVDRFVRGGREINLYSKICEAEAPRTVVICREGQDHTHLRNGDVAWSEWLGDASEPPSVAGPADHLINVLFSSGTTGDPKAIPWNRTTPIKCASDGRFHQDIRTGDVICWPTNIGWMMGPWLIFAALMNRASIALYEGLPSGEGFTAFVEKSGVTMLGVVPSLVRAWRESGAVSTCKWTGIRAFSSTGEPSNREDYLWLMSRTGYRAPVIEYCGGTEIGGGYITGSVLQPASPATFTTPALGIDLVLLDDDGVEVGPSGEGEVFLVPPSIGLSERLLNRDHEEIYHAGCPSTSDGQPLRRHGDQLQKLEGGFWRAQGRADDTMNLGGIKVSSKELERVLEAHPAISEAAAVAVQLQGEGAEKLVVFARATVPTEEIKSELQRAIGHHLNPLFRIHDLVLTDDLPRTASGKLMRRILRRRYTES